MKQVIGLQTVIRRSAMYFSLCVCILIFAPHSSANDTVRVCMPDKTALPFYHVDKDGVISGLTPQRIDQLFASPDLLSLNVEPVLLPWKRCLLSLEKGESDMLVAAHSDQRAMKFVYPDALGFSLSDSALSEVEVCLVKRDIDNWHWSDNALYGRDSILLGIEPGFVVESKRFEDIELRFFYIDDLAKKYQLLEKGRVDAVTAVCGVDGQDTVPDSVNMSSGMSVLRPSFMNEKLYTVFSQRFCQTHASQCRAIISAVSKLTETR